MILSANKSVLLMKKFALTKGYCLDVTPNNLRTNNEENVS